MTPDLPDAPLTHATKRRFWPRFWAHPLTRIALFLLVFAAIAAALSLLLVGALKLLHHRPGHDRTLGQILAEALTATAAVLATWTIVRFADHRPWASAGLTWRGLPAGLGRGFLLGTLMLSAGILVYRLLGAYHVSEVTLKPFLLTPLLLYLVVAVFEETLFRGYIFQTLEARWGSGIALGATGLLFGLAHLGNPTPGASLWQHLSGPLQICLEAGLPLGAAYLLTRSLWLSIGIHWAWDYCEGPVYGCPDSGFRDPHTLLHAVFTGPAWLTGGAFGPEAGLVFLVVGILTGVLLLRAAIRKGNWQPRPRRA